MEFRIAASGLLSAVINAMLAWCTHAWYFEVLAFVSICVCIFGYAYMDK